ncbi:hypothetical protein [Haloarcula pellucida]|uniref:Envelope protein N-terminal domain-containing protein n=1 Tax=Haloarcula pellucida TaxID=1427151 RepID=A0A830GL67_9EURY|nr:hypothetical protein [Halomicroarcula pellucida]GGN92797.1 hypothetical protein GCM10009030_17400 [Halomicroarcula pellucida]
MTDRARSLALSALIIWSTVLVGVGPSLVGPAEAQTDAQTYTFDGSDQGASKPRVVAVDVSNMTGTVTVEWSSGDTGSPSTYVLERRTVTAPFSANELAISNQGAYSTVNVTVTGGSGNASFNGYKSRLTMPDDVKTFGGTGGDRNRICNLHEQLSESVDPRFTMLDCEVQPGTTTVNTTGTDAAQVESDIYQSAMNQKAATDRTFTQTENHLEDAQTVALIKGKNAYVRALNNGSSKAAAIQEGKDAIDEFYLPWQVELVNEFKQSRAEHEYLKAVATNESGVSGDFVAGYHDQTGTSKGDIVDHQQANFTYGTRTVSLFNGTTMTVHTIYSEVEFEGSVVRSDKWSILDPDGYSFAGGDARAAGFSVTDPNTGNHTQTFDYQRFNTNYNEIDAQHQNASAQLEILANNTYDAYQSGELNSTDLIDPYILVNERSAGPQFQGWAASMLTALGQNSPENFDQMGSFNITTETGESHRGILFSPENPASGQFAANQTYDPTAIGGTQYVVTADRIVELQENFTVQNITTTDGERVQNVTIEKTTYKTTNVTELKQLYEDLAYKRAQIEAREQALRAASGGGLFGGGSVPPTVALGVVGVLVLLAALND